MYNAKKTDVNATDFMNLDFYHGILEQARDLILIVDPGGKILYANQAAVKAYGYSPEEFLGLTIYKLRRPGTRSAVEHELDTAARSGLLFRTVHVRQNGECFPVEVSSGHFHFSGRDAVISMIRDITETVRMEEKLRRKEEQLYLLNEKLMTANEELVAADEELRQQLDELARSENKVRQQNAVLELLHTATLGLLQQHDIEAVLMTIINSATQLIGTPHGYIGLLDKEQGFFVRKIGLGYYSQDVGRRIKMTEGLMGQAYKTAQIMVVDDYSTWSERLPEPFFDKLRSVAQVPLKVKGAVIGTFALTFLDPGRKFSSHDIYLLERFADIASLAMGNADLYFKLSESEKNLQKNNEELTAAHEELLAADEELRQQFDELCAREDAVYQQNIILQSLHETAMGLMNRLDPDDLLGMIVSAATKLAGTEHGFIYHLDKQTGTFHRRHGLGIYATSSAYEIPLDQGIMGRVVKGGEPIVVNDYAVWRKNNAYSVPVPDICSILQVPLKSEGQVIGMIGLAHCDSGKTFVNNEIQLLSRFAELASIAMDNALLVASYKNELQIRKQAEQDLLKSQESNQALLNSIPDPLFIIRRSGECIDCKAHAGQLYLPPEYFIGKKVSEVLPPRVANKMLKNIEVALATGEIQIFEYQLAIHNEVQYYEARTIASGPEQVLVIIRDITGRKRMEALLEHLSLHDVLTGVYNRTYFEEQMKSLQAIEARSAGILICDVDGLKIVNDTLGHNTGDAMLKTVAQILQASVQSGDIVARIGGDEFAVVCPARSTKQLEVKCHQIYDRVARYNSENPTVPISLSIGFAVNRQSLADIDALFKEADNNMYREKLHRQKSARSAIVQALIKALQARDYMTEGHGDRLQDLVEKFARSFGLAESNIADFRLLAHFHDIGKVGIPDSILFKPGKLTEEEWHTMRRHCEIGYRIAVSAPDLTPIADWILKHHEWWNGKGYPLGIAGEEIPLACRMLSLVDTFDAMTNDRSYRKAVSYKEALAEIRRCAGTQFDPALAAFFIDMIEAEEV